MGDRAPAGGEREGDPQGGRTFKLAESGQLAFAGMTTAATGAPAAGCGLPIETKLRMAPRHRRRTTPRRQFCRACGAEFGCFCTET